MKEWSTTQPNPLQQHRLDHSSKLLKQESVFDESRSGALKSATTKDNVKKIHDLVLADCRLKVREIAETVGISKDCVGHILH